MIAGWKTQLEIAILDRGRLSAGWAFRSVPSPTRPRSDFFMRPQPFRFRERMVRNAHVSIVLRKSEIPRDEFVQRFKKRPGLP